MESMKTMLKEMKSDPVITLVNNSKITREAVTRRIVSKREEKNYRIVYDKRIIINDGVGTIPFGFIWKPNEHCTQSEESTQITYNIDSLKLFSEHHKPETNSPDEQCNSYVEEEEIEEESDTEENESIDLFATSSESESDYDEYTAEDIAFYDDDNVDQDVCFYRAIDNDASN